MKRNIVTLLAVFSLFLLAFLGYYLLNDRQYVLISMLAAVLSCVPFFVRFEKRKIGEREIVMIAVMTALNVASRFVFAPVQHFKPVTAITIITGIHFGSDAGFVTGALTAIISNFQYGQGPWTPFQMAVWGIIGFLSGFLKNANRIVRVLFAAVSGVLYSLLMDIWTTLSAGDGFSAAKYLTFVASSLPVMLTYVVSNVIFIFLLDKPIGNRLERMKTKYGIFQE